MDSVKILVGLSYNVETGQKKEFYADVPIGDVKDRLTKLKELKDN